MRSDVELLEAWGLGDKDAGNELLRRHFSSVFRFFDSKVREGAKDLAQRTFLGCVEARESFRKDASFRAFLFGIARKQLLLFFRKKHRSAKVFAPSEVSVEELGLGEGSPSVMVARHDEQRLLLRALRRIPIDLQLTVELFYWEELQLDEVATVLEIPIGTVKSRLNRARDRLKREIAALATSEDLRRTTVDNLDRWAKSLALKAPGREDG